MPASPPIAPPLKGLDRREALAALFAFATLTATPGCAKRSDAKGNAGEVLRVGDQRGAIQALMNAAGVLDGLAYKIEWVLLPAAAPLLEALSAGAIDVGGVGGAPFAFAIGNGAPIKAIVASRLREAAPEVGKSSAIIVRKDSTLRAVADLRGRKLATIRGSSGHDVALRLLERAKVDPKSVDFVFLNNDDAKAALAAGHIDAWSTWGPYVGIAVEENGDRVLANASALVTKGQIAGFEVASEAAIRDKSDLLRDFLGRIVKARAWVLKNPEAYVQEIAKETGVPAKVARYNVAYALSTEYAPIDAALIEDQRKTLERYYAAGVIAVMPKVTADGYSSAFNDITAKASVADAGRRSFGAGV